MTARATAPLWMATLWEGTWIFRQEWTRRSSNGSLSKTADGAFLLMMKVYEDEAIDFKTVMKKEIKEALK